MTIEIILTRGYTTIVDDCDADLAGINWAADVQPTTVYARRTNQDRSVTILHRQIYERILGRALASHEIVDHKDLDGLNNTRRNLRLCTRAEDLRNRRTPKHNTSGYKGVSRDKRRGLWIAVIRADKKRHFLGHFEDPVEAAKAYDQRAIELHGAFAHINFPAPSGKDSQ